MKTPNKITPQAPTVQPSIGMSMLLDDAGLVKSIAASAADLDVVLAQIQRDIVLPENRDTVGPTVLALRHIQEILFLFKARAELNKAESMRSPQ